MSFLNCRRCKHYAVTADNFVQAVQLLLPRVVQALTHGQWRWTREYVHAPRLSDRYTISGELRRGIFKAAAVEAASERARPLLHPTALG